MLGISVCHLGGLARRGLLRAEKPTRLFEASYVSLWDVCRLKYEPEKAGWLRTLSRLRPPLYPRGWTIGPAPLGVAVITVKQAERLLDCTLACIQAKIKTGKLEGYKDPGLRKGGGCLITERSVERYRDDWSRRVFRRREHYRKPTNAHHDSADATTMPEWMDARQVAHYMRITVKRVYDLRKAGRLTSTPHSPGRIRYLFARCAVLTLLADPQYAKRSVQGKFDSSPEQQTARRDSRINAELEEITRVMQFAPKLGIHSPDIW